MLASVAVLMLGFSLPERPWSVALTPHVGVTVIDDGRFATDKTRTLISAGGSLELGFRPIPWVRVLAIGFGVLHENNTSLVDGGQSGIVGGMAGLESLVPIGLVEISAGLAAGPAWIHRQAGRVCRETCSYLVDIYADVGVITPTLGVSVQNPQWPWLQLGAVLRAVVPLGEETAVHLHLGVRVEARF